MASALIAEAFFVMYTVWQGDRLLGETDLTYEPLRPRHRGGTFFPSPGTEALIPTADLSLTVRDAKGRVVPTDWVAVYDLDGPTVERDDDDLENVEFEEMLDAELETDYDMALVREWLAQRDAFDEQEDDPFDDEFSRYQIQLMLADGATIP